MKSKARPANKAERERMARLKDLRCVACRANNHFFWSVTECHHLLSGNKRRGHAFTIPLCPWHHRGDVGEFNVKTLEAILGPSLARSSKAFRARYGDDDTLLAATNRLLESQCT